MFKIRTHPVPMEAMPRLKELLEAVLSGEYQRAITLPGSFIMAVVENKYNVIDDFIAESIPDAAMMLEDDYTDETKLTITAGKSKISLKQVDGVYVVCTIVTPYPRATITAWLVKYMYMVDVLA